MKKKISFEKLESFCVGGVLSGMYFDMRDLIKKENKRMKKRITEKQIDKQIEKWIEELNKRDKPILVEITEVLTQIKAYRLSYVVFLLLIKEYLDLTNEDKINKYKKKPRYAIIGYYDENEEHPNLEIREIEDTFDNIKKKEKEPYLSNDWVDDGIYLMFKIE